MGFLSSSTLFPFFFIQIIEKEIAEVHRKLLRKLKEDDQMVARIQTADREKETVEGRLCECSCTV